MRMWNINPKFMCDKHLLGEHVEMHMFVGTLNLRKNIQGYLDNQLIEIHNIRKRHDELVNEMKKRGMKHFSKLPKFKSFEAGYVDSKLNLSELKRRCRDCRERS